MNTFKTFFYSLRRSLFDLSYYKDIAKAKLGFSLKYLWFLLFILTLIKVITLTGAYVVARPSITPAVNNTFTYVENLYPRGLELNIKNGQLSTNVKEPYVFELDKNMRGVGEKRHFMVIDTQGTIEDYPYYNAYVLATKNAVVYPSKSRNNQINETSVFYFRDIKQDVKIDEKVVDGIIDKIRPYAAKAVFFVDWFVGIGLVALLVFGSVFWTASIMFGLLLLNVIIWIVSKLMRRPYSYGDLYRMGMHAVTWPIIFSEAVFLLKLPIPNLYALIFLIFMIIVLIRSEETEKPVKVIAKSKSTKTSKNKTKK